MDDLQIFDSLSDFYQFNNLEIQSGYVTGLWSNQFQTQHDYRFMVEPGSTIGRSGFKNTDCKIHLISIMRICSNLIKAIVNVIPFLSFKMLPFMLQKWFPAVTHSNLCNSITAAIPTLTFHFFQFLSFRAFIKSISSYSHRQNSFELFDRTATDPNRLLWVGPRFLFVPSGGSDKVAENSEYLGRAEIVWETCFLLIDADERTLSSYCDRCVIDLFFWLKCILLKFQELIEDYTARTLMGMELKSLKRSLKIQLLALY